MLVATADPEEAMAAVPPIAAAPLPWEDPIRPGSRAFLETLRLIALEPTLVLCCVLGVLAAVSLGGLAAVLASQ